MIWHILLLKIYIWTGLCVLCSVVLWVLQSIWSAWAIYMDQTIISWQRGKHAGCWLLTSQQRSQGKQCLVKHEGSDVGVGLYIFPYVVGTCVIPLYMYRMHLMNRYHCFCTKKKYHFIFFMLPLITHFLRLMQWVIDVRTHRWSLSFYAHTDRPGFQLAY